MSRQNQNHHHLNHLNQQQQQQQQQQQHHHRQHSQRGIGLEIRAESATLYQEVVSTETAIAAPTPIVMSVSPSTSHGLSSAALALPIPSVDLSPTKGRTSAKLHTRKKQISAVLTSVHPQQLSHNHHNHHQQQQHQSNRNLHPTRLSSVDHSAATSILHATAQSSTSLMADPGAYYSIPHNPLDPDLSVHFAFDPAYNLASVSSLPEPQLDANADPDAEMEFQLAETMNIRAGDLQADQIPGSHASLSASASAKGHRSKSKRHHNQSSQPLAPSVKISHVQNESGGQDRLNTKHRGSTHQYGDSIVQSENGDRRTSLRSPDLERKKSTVQSVSEDAIYGALPDVVLKNHHHTLSQTQPLPSETGGDRNRSTRLLSSTPDPFPSSLSFTHDTTASISQSLPELEITQGSIFNEAAMAQMLNSTKMMEAKQSTKRNVRQTSPPPPPSPLNLPSPTKFSERIYSPSGKGQKTTQRDSADPRKYTPLSNIRGMDTRSLQMVDLQKDNDEGADFSIGKTVALLLAAGEKPNPHKGVARGRAVFEALLAEAQKKREKMLSEGVDQFTAHASTVQLELKAYDRAFQEVYKQLRDQNSEVAHLVSRIYNYLKGLVTELPDYLKDCSWKLQDTEGLIKDLKAKIRHLQEEKTLLEHDLKTRIAEIAVHQEKWTVLEKELEEAKQVIKNFDKEKSVAMDSIEDERNNMKILEQQIRELLTANRNIHLHSYNLSQDLESSMQRCFELEKELSSLKQPSKSLGGKEKAQPSTTLNPATQDKDDPSKHSTENDAKDNALDNIGSQETASGGDKKQKGKLPNRKASKQISLPSQGNQNPLFEEVQGRLNRLQPLGAIDLNGDMTQKLIMLVERLSVLELAAGKEPSQTLSNQVNKGDTVKCWRRYIPYLDDVDRTIDFHKRGIRGMEWLSIMIEQIYDAKGLQDRVDMEQGHSVDEFPEFVISWALKKKGNKKLGKQLLWDLYASGKKFRSETIGFSFFMDYLEEKRDLEELTYYLLVRQAFKDGNAAPQHRPHQRHNKQSASQENQTLETIRVNTLHCKSCLQVFMRSRNDDYIQSLIVKAQSYRHNTPTATPKTFASMAMSGAQGFKGFKASSSYLTAGSVPSVELYTMLNFVIEDYATEKADMKKKLMTFFENMDSDRDGLLSEDEFKALCVHVYPRLSEREASKVFIKAVSSSGKDGIDPDSALCYPDKWLVYMRQFIRAVPVTEDTKATEKENQDLHQLILTNWRTLSSCWDEVKTTFPKIDHARVQKMEDYTSLIANTIKRGMNLNSVAIFRGFTQELCRYLIGHLQSNSMKVEDAGAEFELVLRFIQHYKNCLISQVKENPDQETRPPTSSSTGSSEGQEEAGNAQEAALQPQS